MRKLLLSFLILVVAVASQAQTSYKKKPTLAVNFILNDFKTASFIRQSSFNTTLKNHNWSRFNQMNAGLGLQYLTGISNHFDFNSNLQLSFVDYPFPQKQSYGNESALFELDATVNAKLFTDNHFVTPYLTAGVGASKYRSNFAAFIPVGVGVQFNLGNQESFLFTNFQYRVPVTILASHHFNYSIGFAAPLGGK
jgi:OOP family OmpA-OmpF porin